MKALTTAASGIRHAVGAAAEATLVALIAATLLFALAPVSAPANSLAGAGTAEAGKAVARVWIDGASSSRLSGLVYGDRFTVGYETTAREPWAHARCYPNASTVYRETYGDGWVWGQYFSVYPGGPQGQQFQLIDPVAENWTSGGADCVLRLLKSGSGGRETLLASTVFTVAP